MCKSVVCVPDDYEEQGSYFYHGIDDGRLTVAKESWGRAEGSAGKTWGDWGVCVFRFHDRKFSKISTNINEKKARLKVFGSLSQFNAPESKTVPSMPLRSGHGFLKPLHSLALPLVGTF